MAPQTPAFRVKMPLEDRILAKMKELGAEVYITSLESDDDPYCVPGRVVLAPQRIVAERLVNKSHRLATKEEIAKCLEEDAERKAKILAAGERTALSFSPAMAAQFAKAMNASTKQGNHE